MQRTNMSKEVEVWERWDKVNDKVFCYRSYDKGKHWIKILSSHEDIPFVKYETH